LAGVPAIMQAMLDDVATRLKTGARMIAETIPAGGLFEGAYAAALADLAAANPELSIGSYPAFRDGGFHNEIVVRGKDAAKVAAATAAITTMVARLAKGRA
ncbi:MAG: competence/damage-inducible protein A, partial [Methylocella sp.]